MAKPLAKLSRKEQEVENKFQGMFSDARLLRGRLKNKCCYKIVIIRFYSPKPGYFAVEDYPIFASRSLTKGWESNPFLPEAVVKQMKYGELKGGLIRLDNKPSHLFPHDKPPSKDKSIIANVQEAKQCQ